METGEPGEEGTAVVWCGGYGGTEIWWKVWSAAAAGNILCWPGGGGRRREREATDSGDSPGFSLFLFLIFFFEG